jgi:hypothetical protein
MGGWKLFALLNVLLTSYGLHDLGDAGPAMTLNFVIEVISTIGLVLMAFELNFLPGRFWRVFAGVSFVHCFIALVAAGLTGQYALDGRGLEAFLVYALFHFAVGYGLWLSGSKRDQHGQAQLAS